MSPSPRYDLNRVRSQIPSLQHFIPMNNCSQAPRMELTREAAEAYLESWGAEVMVLR